MPPIVTSDPFPPLDHFGHDARPSKVAADRSDDGPYNSLMQDNAGDLVKWAILIIGGIIVFIFLTKIILKRVFGATIFPRARTANAQERADFMMASRLQLELDEEARQEASQQKMRSKRQKLEKKLEENTMVVEEMHLDRIDPKDLEGGRNDGIDSIYDDDGVAGGKLIIPEAKVPSRDLNCAICLGKYEAGDTVIWSPNESCLHVFHEECIISWLCRDKRQCPCCRMPFVSLDDDIGMTKNVATSSHDDEPAEPSDISLDEAMGSGDEESPPEEGSQV